jgi:hypothetical protein
MSRASVDALPPVHPFSAINLGLRDLSSVGYKWYIGNFYIP